MRAQVDGELAAPLLEVSSTTAIKAAVMGGIGPAVLSMYAVAAELTAGTLVRVDAPGLDLTRRLRAIWPAGRNLEGPAGDLLAVALRGAGSVTGGATGGRRAPVESRG